MGAHPPSTLPKTNIAPEKWCLEYQFPFGIRPIFRGELLVLGRVVGSFSQPKNMRAVGKLGNHFLEDQGENIEKHQPRCANVLGSKLPMLGMVISPLIGIVIMGPYKPLLLG